MSRLIFQWEPLSTALDQDDLIRLIESQWREIGQFQDIPPLDVDWDALLAREVAGTWRGMTGRRDGTLISYAAFHLFNPPHYKSTLYAVEDIIAVVPEARNRGMVWYQTAASAMRMMPRPCHLIFHGRMGMPSYPMVEQIMTRLGLTAKETVYGCNLV